MTAVKNYLRFAWRCARVATEGDWRYYLWVGLLFAVCLLGLNAYAKQFVHGLIVTDMTDQVSWGVYIANFTFTAGIAAAAVILVIPVFVYRNEDLQDLVIFGELLAVAGIIMCLAFVTVDLGRPDRFWHLIPGVGKFNFPGSMLSWDVIVLNGYLVLNAYICGYLLYCRYRNQRPVKWLYAPFVVISILWAIFFLTVEAFLYLGLGSRPFWNSAVLGPRFLAAAFAAGPAFMILALQVVRRATATPVINPDLAAGKSQTLSARPATLQDLEHLGQYIAELATVPPEARSEILENAVVIHANAGDTLLRQGEVDDTAFFILKGCVVVRLEESGRHRIIRSVGPGEQFGEVSALNQSPRAATAVAEDSVVVLRITVRGLKKMMSFPVLRSLIRSRMHERLLITDRGLMTLRSIVQISMLLNVFLMLNEVFKEFYTDSLHAASAKYLFVGLHGNHALVPWIWTAIAFNLISLTLLLLPASRSLKWLDLACVLAIVGIWIEKAMGLVVPGFVPTPLGEIVEYSPTLNETLICLGIWAFGLLCYTILLRMAVPILQGRLTRANERVSSPAGSHSHKQGCCSTSK
jgi:Ni/Fe-hydrogenase subunit HybB-like protein